jgi:hypothetical protein
VKRSSVALAGIVAALLVWPLLGILGIATFGAADAAPAPAPTPTGVEFLVLGYRCDGRSGVSHIELVVSGTGVVVLDIDNVKACGTGI